MRYLIMLEQTDDGFAAQVPDLAVITHGATIASARVAAIEAIRINLETYAEVGQPVPVPQDVARHLSNPEFGDLLFAFVDA